MTVSSEYDPRYLQGIAFFNAGDYFEAHEVWEDLWHDTAGSERRFYQALIQAAVAVYHASNGNARGATRLFHSAQRYMQPFGARYEGLDIPAFWEAMQRAFQPLLNASRMDAVFDLSAVPTIVLTDVAHG